MFFTRLLTTCLCACFISHTAGAQTDSRSEDLTTSSKSDKNANSPTRLETVVVSARQEPSTLKTAPISISVVSEDVFSSTQSEHPAEVLAAAPGAWINRGSGQEQLSAIRSPVFTGPGACANFLIAEDSIPVRAKAFCNTNQLFDSHYETAERIEVVRGPNASRFGGNAMFGAVNVISPSAQQNNQVALTGSSLNYNRLDWSLQNQHAASFGSLLDDRGWRDDEQVKQQKLGFKLFGEGDRFIILPLLHPQKHPLRWTTQLLNQGTPSARIFVIMRGGSQ